MTLTSGVLFCRVSNFTLCRMWALFHFTRLSCYRAHNQFERRRKGLIYCDPHIIVLRFINIQAGRDSRLARWKMADSFITAVNEIILRIITCKQTLNEQQQGKTTGSKAHQIILLVFVFLIRNTTIFSYFFFSLSLEQF